MLVVSVVVPGHDDDMLVMMPSTDARAVALAVVLVIGGPEVAVVEVVVIGGAAVVVIGWAAVAVAEVVLIRGSGGGPPINLRNGT